MKDDLISMADVCEILADMYPTDGEAIISYKEIDRAFTKVRDLPSVPAVPLDMVCELLATNADCPPGHNPIMDHCRESGCAECWKSALKEWEVEEDNDKS